MAFLVRKISRGKWPNEPVQKEEIEADAISDIRTTKNTLSLWRVESEAEIESAVLALSASSKSEQIETIDIVWIPESVFDNYGIEISEETPGDTVVEDLANNHRDLIHITYKTLGDIAEIITKEILDQAHYKKVTKSKVKELLINAYKDKRILEEKCTPKMLEKIKQEYEKSIVN